MTRTGLVAAALVIAVTQAGLAQAPQKTPASGPGGGRAVRQGASRVPPASVNPAPPAAPRATLPRTPLAAPRSLGQTVRPAPASPFDAGPLTYAPRYAPWPRSRPWRSWGAGYYGSIPYEVAEPAPPVDPRPSAGDDESRIGGLSIDLEPRDAELYVDGFFAGRLSDFAADGLPLRAGRHWIDLRAAGYETLTLPVDIVAGQLAHYRAELTAARPAQINPAPPSGSQTIYVIPGCYAGNKPPVESVLPRGCDIGLVRTIKLY